MTVGEKTVKTLVVGVVVGVVVKVMLFIVYLLLRCSEFSLSSMTPAMNNCSMNSQSSTTQRCYHSDIKDTKL